MAKLSLTEVACTNGSAQNMKICPTAEELGPKPLNLSGKIVCSVPGCSSVLKTQGGLVQHIDKCHPDVSRTGGIKKTSKLFHYHCPVESCYYNPESERYFSSMEHLRAHYASQHWEKHHVCDKCGKRFGLYRDWGRHTLVCGIVFACGTCSHSYPSRQALLVHCKRKQHPIPTIWLCDKSKNASTKESLQPEQQVGFLEISTKNKSKGKKNSKIKLSSPRPILPKSILQTTSIYPILSGSSGTDVACGPESRCAQIQTDLVGISPLLQRLTSLGVSTGCQTMQGVVLDPDCNSSAQQVPVANMAIQVSTGLNKLADFSQISHVGTQVCVDVVNSGTQMSNESCTKHFTGQLMVVSNTTRQLSDNAGSSFQIGWTPQMEAVAATTVQVAGAVTQTDPDETYYHGTQIIIDPNFSHHWSTIDGTHIGIQTSLPCIATSSNICSTSVGTQIFSDPLLIDEAQTSTTGMQTSVSLLPNRIRHSGVIAQTQTSGDSILRSAMESACIPVAVKSPVKCSLRTSSRKRSLRSSECQTQVISPCKRQRQKKEKQIMVASGTNTASLLNGMAAHDTKDKLRGDVSLADLMTDSATSDFFPGQRILWDDSSDHVQQNSTWSPEESSHNARVWPKSTLSDLSKTTCTSKSNSVQTEEAVTQRQLLSSVQTTVPIEFTDNDNDNDTETFDLLASSPSHGSFSTDASIQAQDLDDFLSSCTVDFGVQTQDNFPSACTTDFGVQTQNDFMEVCTADFGVQTATSSMGSYLYDFEGDTSYGSLINNADNKNDNDLVKQATVRPLDSCVTVHECGTETDLLMEDTHTQTTQHCLKDSECWKDAGLFEIEKEAVLGNIHTHEGHGFPDISDSISNLSALVTDRYQNSKIKNFDTAEESLCPLPSFSGGDSVGMSERLSQDVSKEFHFEITSLDDLIPEKDISHLPNSELVSSSSLETDFTVVSGADMHTQTANDLFDFLMTNMETQTTEDIFAHNFALTDIQTQTTPEILLSPIPSLSPILSSASAGYSSDLVTTQTQTSSSLLMVDDDDDDNDDDDDLSHLIDMQTQTAFDVWDVDY